MIRVDRIYSWVFIATFALLVPSVKFLKFTDELSVIVLFGVALFDSYFSRDWKKYKGLWITSGIMMLYALYSLVFMHYNTPKAIIADMLIQMKPFVPFFAFIAAGAYFTAFQKLLLKWIAVLNCIFVAVVFLFARQSLDHILQHVSYVGIIAFVSSIVFIFCSIDYDGNLKKTSLLQGLLLMAVGLLGTRAKFFATFVIAIYFLWFYRPGLSAKSVLKVVSLSVVVITAVVAVSWYKFQYYFIIGNSGRFDPEVMEAFARPIMYATSFMILISHIPFGSGLASFASYASGDIHYSSIYYDYGINHIVGLSPHDTSCICDAFYPSLAQFGFVGIALFIYFWIYIALRLKKTIRMNHKYKSFYAIGWIIILFILIESVASTTFVQSGGQCSMMILGGICHLATNPIKTTTATAMAPVNKPAFSFIDNSKICLNQTQ